MCVCLFVFFFWVLFVLLGGVFFQNASNSLFCLPTVKQLILNSEQINIVQLDYSGDRGTVCHSLLFGKADLL